ncbi:DUF4097 family beta strand repeat-containing protein [Sutcliffiella cohnii]|uniref:DUF4097 family beta strand repeat-containing protein n=1 Tax=Sutcliffiella cohnii TaxID=33932 RepID=UPI002E1FCA35|nr:DUF4097 family beta strand repeat-containing protein [Sutcliffiella cohnii]
MKYLGMGLFLLIALFTIYNLIINASWSFGNSKSDEVAVTDSINTITIEGSSSSIQVVAEDRSSVKAELEGKGDVLIEKKGKTIAVEYKPPTFRFISFGRQKITVYIPESFNKTMEFDIGSGNVNFEASASNPIILEELQLDIRSGNAKLEHIQAKMLESDVSSGNVTIRNVTVEDGSFDVRSGNTTIRNIVGSFDANVSSGNLQVSVDELTGDVKMQVSSGRATLQLPKDADFTLNGSISSGHINTGFPFDQIDEDRRSVEASHGNGTHSIELKVSSGSIKVH